MKAWLPRIGSFLINAVQRSRGGGKIKLGTLITSTRISQSTSSATKNITGSAMSFQENFTALLRADVKGKRRWCQENRAIPIPADLNPLHLEPDQKGPDARRAQSLRARAYSYSTFERADPAQRSRWAFFIRLTAP